MTDPNEENLTEPLSQIPRAEPPADAKSRSDTAAGEARRPTVSGLADYPYLGPATDPEAIAQLGTYRILRILGRGGMGVVFEGKDPVLGRLVAIKVPLGEADNERFRARFLREARAAATLSNEHIATIYQVGQQDDVLFLVMELLRGEPLDRRLDREKTLAVSESLRIGREIAEGLREAHAHGLIHRDIKPANIWLEKREGHAGPPRVKLLDFGLARETRPEEGQQGLTSPGAIVGTIGYMAPEQVFAGELDARTDLFALGCVLYEMLIGQLPFKGKGTVSSLKAVVYEQPVAAEVAAPFIPKSVSRLIDDLLQKEPSSRPQNAGVVIERIQEIERELMRQTVALPSTSVNRVTGLSKDRMSHSAFYGAAVVLIAGLVGLVVLANKLRGPTGEQLPAPENRFVGEGEPIKVGILHSLTGPLAASETPLVETLLMAVDEINQSGGVLGRRLEPVVEDGLSTEEGFTAAAEKLLKTDNVAVIFGCWSSSCRKRVESVARRFDSLLVYSLSYEGLEDSPYVMYVGGGPNQQLIPAVKWAVGFLAKRKFFLVGSEEIYSRGSSAILCDEIKAVKAEVVGEAYLRGHEVSGAKFADIAARIKSSGAEAVFSTVDGQSANITFFQALSEAGITAKEFPIISFSFYETELRHLPERDSIGHFAVANYFSCMQTPANQEFLKRFKARHATRVVTDPIVSSYGAMFLWKQAVEEANQTTPAAVREAMARQKYEGPEGLIALDPGTHHAMRTPRVGKVVSSREFEIVYAAPKPQPPVPFPPTRTREEWEKFATDLYHKWGDHWEELGPK